MNSESVTRLTALHAVSSTNPAAYQGSRTMGSSFGTNVGTPSRYRAANPIAPTVTINRPPLISASRSIDVGRYLMKLLLNPKRLTYEISDAAEISVVASPIWLGLNTCAQMIQKRN